MPGSAMFEAALAACTGLADVSSGSTPVLTRTSIPAPLQLSGPKVAAPPAS